MTAIDKFIRLEAVGWWYEAGRQEAREVIVSFGDATLQLTSLTDVPLTHWSLLATRRIGTRGEAVIYSADPEQHEVLEIDDGDMIRAISAVTSALTPQTPKPKTRWFWRLALIAVLLAGLSQTPPLIYGMASLTTPPARLADLSAVLRQEAGEVCEGWQGRRALQGFAEALFPEHPPEMTVINGLSTAAQALPSGDILISKQAVETLPASQLAAAITAEWAYASNGGAKSTLIESLGPMGALRSLITGRFPSPLPPQPAPSLSAEDFILARDHLLALGYSPDMLQTLASAYGLGLPLPQTSLPVFNFPEFEILQGICAEGSH